MGMKMKVRETMTKKGDKEMEHSFEVRHGQGVPADGHGRLQEVAEDRSGRPLAGC